MWTTRDAPCMAMADYSALRHPDADEHVSLGVREHTISNLSRDTEGGAGAQLCVRTVEAFDADSCPGCCLCEEEIECSRPCCTVRRPLRCAGLVFLVVAIVEAAGLFGVSAAVAYQNWPSSPKTPSRNSSGDHSLSTTPSAAAASSALLNEASVDSIMSMYSCLCYAVFSVGAIRSESRVELTASVGFSWLVVAFVAFP